MGCGGVDMFCLVQDNVWRELGDEPSGSLRGGNVFTSQATLSLSWRALLYTALYIARAGY
jgi:hypothetical protein